MDKKIMEMSDTDLTVVCFLWHGDRWKRDDMGVEYVNRLFRGVQRNLSAPHSFICFTNESGSFDRAIEVRSLSSPSWKGCLPRLYMYSPDAALGGQVLALDIDLVIVGSLDEIASYRGEFCVRRKFRRGMEHKIDGDIIGFRPPFGLLRFWKPFVTNPKLVEQVTGGRERYWYRRSVKSVDIWQDLYPGQIVSYKRHVKDGLVPRGARIVSCHGRPRPHEIKEPWIKEHWR